MRGQRCTTTGWCHRSLFPVGWNKQKKRKKKHTQYHHHRRHPSRGPSSLTAAEKDTVIDDMSSSQGGRELKGRSSVTADRKRTGWRLMVRLRLLSRPGDDNPKLEINQTISGKQEHSNSSNRPPRKHGVSYCSYYWLLVCRWWWFELIYIMKMSRCIHCQGEGATISCNCHYIRYLNDQFESQKIN